MSLFTPIVKEKTKEDFIREVASKIVSINTEVKDFIIRKVAEAFALVQTPNVLPDYAMLGERQESPFGVTTQEVLDFLEANGISTLKLFQSSGALQDFLVATVEDYQRLIPKPFTVEDGKIISE